MKRIFQSILAVLVMAIAVPVSAQYSGYLLDTLVSSSSVATIYLYPGGTSSDGAGSAAAAKAFTAPGTLDVIMHTDSLSGATNATLYIEVANTASPNLWYPVSTTTLNGPTVQKIHFEDTDFSNLKWRIYGVTASGTQSTRVKAEWRFKPN